MLRHHRLPLLLLLAVWLLLVGRVLVGQASPVPLISSGLIGVQLDDGSRVAAHRFGADPAPTSFDLPALWLVARGLRQGGLLQLNPYAGLGQPLLANLQARPFSPLQLPLLLAPSLRVYALTLTVHLLVALLGAYLLFVQLGSGRALALAAAVAWALSPNAIGQFSYLNAAGAAFVPWVLIGLLRRLRGHSRWPLDLLALTLVAWCGHPSDALYAAGLWSLLVLGLPPRPSWRARVELLIHGGGTVLLTTAPLTFPYLANLGVLVSYKEYTDFVVRFPLSDFFSPRGLIAVAPLLVLLWQPWRDAATRFWGGAALAALALLVVVAELVPALQRLPVSLYYAPPYALLLLSCAVLVSQPDGEPARPPWAPALVLAGLLLGGRLWLAPAQPSPQTGASWVDLATVPIWLVALALWLLPRLKPAAPWLRTLPSAAVVRALVAVALLLWSLGSVSLARELLYLTPPPRLVQPHPLSALGVEPGLDRRLAVVGTRMEERPLPPNLAGLWGYADISVMDPVVPVGYLQSYLPVFGKPPFPTVFTPLYEPRLDPALLGVDAVIRRGDDGTLRVERRGGRVASWSAGETAAAMALEAPQLGFRGTWQTLSWALPAAAQQQPGTAELKYVPLPGYRYLDDSGAIQPVPVEVGQRWLQLPTRPGQQRITLLYREDGFWLGLLAALAGLVLLWRGRVRAAPTPGVASDAPAASTTARAG